MGFVERILNGVIYIDMGQGLMNMIYLRNYGFILNYLLDTSLIRKHRTNIKYCAFTRQ